MVRKDMLERYVQAWQDRRNGARIKRLRFSSTIEG